MHTNVAALELEAKAYHGGRCEVYRLGELQCECWMVDVRSMYGDICRTQYLPVSLLNVYTDWDRSLGRRYGGPLPLIADVVLRTDEPLYPYVSQHVVIYPVGRFRTVLAGPELQLAIDRHHIVDFKQVAEYRMGTYLAEWAGRICDLRDSISDAAVPGVDAALKRLLCCLPGKFAQRLKRWERCPAVDWNMDYGESWAVNIHDRPTRFRWVAGNGYYETDQGLHPDANLAIAAWITSCGRVWLRQMCEIAGLEHVYYVDTDALIVDAVGLENLRQTPSFGARQCGALTVRHGPARTIIRALKNYSIGDHNVCAGLPRGVLTDCGDGKHQWYAPAAAEQISDSARPAAVERQIVWPRLAEYRHGVVHPGGRVSPIIVEE